LDKTKTALVRAAYVCFGNQLNYDENRTNINNFEKWKKEK